jgi:glycosyltransferase involved in cell wall biosynthesis
MVPTLSDDSKPAIWNGTKPPVVDSGTKPLSSVDVVVPCYNYGRYLRGCVNSVLEQPGVSVRVLVIDDASSDDTPEIGEELASSDSRVEFRRHASNKGHIATYNEGLIDWTTAKYTVLLSADDMLAPNSLSRATQIMDANNNIGMVYGRAIHFEREAELPRQIPREFDHTTWPGTRWLEGRCRSGQNVITSPEVVVRGSVQRAVGGYQPELTHAGDLEMWLRVAAVSDIAYIRDVPQAFYRVHSNNMHSTVNRGSFLDLCQRRDVFQFFFDQHHQRVEDSKHLHQLANLALAREALWDACRAYDRNRVVEYRADELVEFAMAICSKAKSLPEFSALQRRRRLGPNICNRTQIFAPSAAIRKVRRWALKQRWKSQGI